MCPYFTVPLEGHIRHAWLYLMQFICKQKSNKLTTYISDFDEKSCCFIDSSGNHGKQSSGNWKKPIKYMY